MAVGVLGIGCYVRQADLLEKEKQELLCKEQLTVCGTLIRKEQKNERWQLTLALPGFENRVVVSSQEGGYPLDCVLSVKGLIYEFHTPRNEGQFNEQQYQKTKKVMGRINAEAITCIRAPSGIHAWREALYQFRVRLCAVYETCLPPQTAGILSTMAVGDKSMLEEEVRSLFQKAGISHILAISGMHISMIGMAIYAFLRKTKNSYVRCAIGTAVVLFLYGTLIGMGVSAKRAIGMFLIFPVAQCLGRGYDTASALAVLAIVLLVENPFLLQDVSFQFSFLAVVGVITAEHVLPKKDSGGGWYRRVRPVLLSLLLQLFTFPLVAFYYYELPLYGLFFNLLLLPYLGIALGFGLLGGVAGTFLLPWAKVFLLPCKIVFSVYLWVCRFVEGLPFATVICGKPSIGKIAAYYAMFGVLLFLLEKRRETGKELSDEKSEISEGFGEGGRVCSYLLVGALGLFSFLIAVPKQGFEIDFLDVGQGDASMIRTEQGIVCFVDGGSSDVKGVGTYRILPFLKSKGIRKVDTWILSHLDDDHVNGFYEVLESGYQIDRVVISTRLEESGAKAYLFQMLLQYQIPVIGVNGGDVLRLHNDDSYLQFLSPEEETPVYDENGASLVFLYKDPGISALWTGDIGKTQEEWLLRNGKLQQVDIYKAAHHGSRFSNIEGYLQALSPKLSVVSCAKRNRYGHPEEAAIRHMEAAGSKIFYTMESGQIKVRNMGMRMVVETETQCEK